MIREENIDKGRGEVAFRQKRANVKLIDGEREQEQPRDTFAKPSFMILISVCENEWYCRTLLFLLLLANFAYFSYPESPMFKQNSTNIGKRAFELS